MGNKKTISREDSYVLSEFSAGYLHMLEHRLSEFIRLSKPAFENAGKQVPFKLTKLNYIQRGKEDDRFVEPSDLHEWLIHKKAKLAEFIEKVGEGERNLDSKALNNLRHIRAFFARFESIAKHQYGGVSMFKSVEPELSKLLLERFVPARNEGGIFEITRYLLRDEPFNSKDDLGKIRKSLKVGKTITYVVAAQIKLNEKILTGNADDLAYPAEDVPPATIASTPKARELISEEFGFDDPRKEKPKPARIKAKGKIGDKQLGLNLG